MVDLWDAAGANEVNLVRNSSVSSPIAPATNPASHQRNQYAIGASEQMPISNNYGVPPHQKFQNQGFNSYPAQPQLNQYPGSQAQPYGQAPPQYAQQQYSQYPPQDPQSQAGYANGAGNYQPQTGYGPPPPQSPFYSTGVQSHGMNATSNGDYGAPPQQFQARQYQPEPNVPRNTTNNVPTGMFTRNLIGSLAASASCLIDTNGTPGIWFVLQDLSVRTEGDFRYVFVS